MRLNLSEERANQLQSRYQSLLNSKVATVDGINDLVASLRDQLRDEMAARQTDQQSFKNIIKEQEILMSNLLIQKKIAEKNANRTTVQHPSIFFK
jgi:hypothetical protein